MNSTRRTARIAGVLYLLMAIPAVFSLVYVPTRLIVRGDAAATMANIGTSESLFRAGIASGLVSAILFGALAVALYRLFEEVDRPIAVLMVVLVLIQLPTTFLNSASWLATLTLARGADFVSVFEKEKIDALAMLLLGWHRQGLILSELFWGLWLFPFGMLVYRSGFIPRTLGVYLFVNGFAYGVLSFTGVLWPQHYSAVLRFASPALLGELAILLWLLIVGARPRLPAAADPAAAH